MIIWEGIDRRACSVSTILWKQVSQSETGLYYTETADSELTVEIRRYQE